MLTLTAPKDKKSRIKNTRWKDQFLVDIYILARAGSTVAQIADALGVGESTIEGPWKVAHPEIQYAMDKAREAIKEDRIKDKFPDKEKDGTFADYVYGRLSPNLKEVWDNIIFWSDHANGPEKVEAILEKKGVRMRQQLWVHAMLVCNFNASEAGKMVNVTKRMLDWWTENDPEFTSLIDELHWHKKNFFESKLIKLTKRNSEKAIIHANATVNRDRGYGKTVAVSVNGTVQVNHALIPLDKLDLPVDTLLQLEKAMERLKDSEEKQAEPVSGVTVDASRVTGVNDGVVDVEAEEDDEED